MNSSGDRTLRRDLGPWASASIVVGTVIGTGVFFKTAVMAQYGGSAAWVLVAWAIAGALSFTGAMTYAELGGMFPASGGEYVYLREGLGPFMGFLYGWTRFWVGSPGSIAAYGVGAATFLAAALPLDAIGGIKPAAIALIALFTAINCLNVRSSGRLQTVLTIIKLVMILGIAGGALTSRHGSWAGLGHAGAFPGWSAFGAMVLAALWAYDGWNNLPMAAGEIRDAQRTLPRATVGGMLAVLAIYALVNLGYFHALPFADIVTANSTAYSKAPAIATRAAATFLGDTAQVLLALAMTLSAISAMNGAVLTGARVPYAVAQDGLAPARLGRLSERGHVPVTAIVVQGVLSCALALSGTFDQLTDAVVFASWLFYALNAGSVLLLRRRQPGRERPFRVPGFPVVPCVFIALATLLLVNTLITSPRPSALGLVIAGTGAAVYLIVFRFRRCRRHDVR